MEWVKDQIKEKKSGVISRNLVWKGDYKEFTWRGQSDQGIDLTEPTMIYNVFKVLVTPPAHFIDIQALVFACDKNRYTNLAHVLWDGYGSYQRRQDIYNASWFKDNEDLGDIIKGHRAMKLIVESLERENKANKQKLVQLFNMLETLQEQVKNLQEQVKGVNNEEVMRTISRLIKK